MNIYSVIELENKIDRFAELNNGEIPNELYKELVSEQTKSVQQIESLVKYIKNLELGIDACDTEIERISKMKQKANNRISGIKKYLTPFIAQRGKVESGTFTLTTRKSRSVNIFDESKIPTDLMRVIPEKLEPDKKRIKDILEVGDYVPGAELQEKDNLQIK